MESTRASAPDVSVVIPVYNRTAMLVRAVRSCFEQPCAVEVVVVDDGSTDDVPAALADQFGPDARLRIVRQENQGACVARNRGLALAAGEFIKFLDSDDELLPGALAQEIHAARRDGCDALLTGWEERSFRADGTEDRARRRTRAAPDLSHGIDDMLVGKAPCASSALYRTAFVQPLRWDPAWTKAQDWGWAWVVCLAGARFASLDLPSCAYNHHGGERITGYGDLTIRSTRGRQGLLRMVERELRAQNALTPDRRRKLAQYYYRDCQVLAEYDPAEWRRVWDGCEELCPGFRPAERRLSIRLLTRACGVYRGIRIYVALKRAAWRLRLLPPTVRPASVPRTPPPGGRDSPT